MSSPSHQLRSHAATPPLVGSGILAYRQESTKKNARAIVCGRLTGPLMSQ
ncbi:MAG: hypothetical protein IT576_18635 [Verrucomicrobiales bacterium]|nr:hypothetical protein [Verrucomicrobiales bacterium]